jgi:hypothetical protein
MSDKWPNALVVLAIVGLFLAASTTRAAHLVDQARTPGAQSTPQSQRLAAGEVEVKRLLLLTDTDKSGKISKAGFMVFMEAEFNRLDKDQSGELDPKALTLSQLRTKPGFLAAGK